MIDYVIGDTVTSHDNQNKEIGVCTGFIHDDTCVLIDGKCWGGKGYFVKTEFVEYEIVD